MQSDITKTTAWRALEGHAAALRDTHMRDLFAADAGRFQRFSARLDDQLLLDCSKNRITPETIPLQDGRYFIAYFFGSSLNLSGQAAQQK